MDKKNIIFAAVGFACGILTGAGSVIIAGKIKGKKKSDPERSAPILTPKEEDEKEEPAPVNPNPVEEKKEMEAIIENEGYSAEYEHPEEDDPEHQAYLNLLKAKEDREKYVAEHKGKIELMRQEEWDTDFPEEDYSHAELWYFPDEDILTDEDGNLLEPMEDYVGNLFDKCRFKTNDWEQIYIRNHPREEDYYVHKETQMSREDFFY